MAKKSKTRSKSTGRKVSAAGKHLVIVESPTKAKTINKYLGRNYAVMASVGHVRDLTSTKAPQPKQAPDADGPKGCPKGLVKSIKKSDPSVPGVDIENDFEPTYEILSNKKKTVQDLKRAAKEAKDVWFATDLDREGEAIAWHLAESLGVPIPQAKRVVFNAITASEITHAFSNPRQIDQNKVDAQQARRILDRLVGFGVSPLLWNKVAGGLSAGRVQSVAVQLVVDREREIEAFVPTESWKMTANFATQTDQATQLAADWNSWINQPDQERTIKDRLGWLNDRQGLCAELIEWSGKPFKPGQADVAVAAAQQLGYVIDETEETEDPKGKGPARHKRIYRGHIASASRFEIRSIETKRTTRKSSPPFITSTLQQAASNRLGFPLQRTMRIAQQLYEGVDIHGKEGQTGLITYMRTDSTHLASEAVDMARYYIGDEWGNQYLPDKPNIYKTSNKAAQEAHEAIRPTDVNITPKRVRNELTDEQYKLYRMIWERFLASQMAPAQWDATTVLIEGQIDAKPLFKSTGRTLVFDGHYKAVGIPNHDSAILPPLNDKQEMDLFYLDPTQQFTNPPPRFTEASLQKKLEEEQIGRPSTYAQIIETIQNRKYVEPMAPRDRRLRATDLGTVVTDLLVEAFPTVRPTFMDIAYTRDMEDELDKIESDNHNWIKMLYDFYDPFKQSLEEAYKNLGHVKAKTQPAPHTCPECGSPTEFRFGRNGRFLSCTAYYVPPQSVTLKQCTDLKFLLFKAVGKARPKIISKDNTWRVSWTKLMPKQKKEFQELSDQMPSPCEYAAPIDDEGNPIKPQVYDIICPSCSGPMTKRDGRFGPFLGCANYPACKGIVNIDPKKHTVKLPKPPPLMIDLTCPKCDQPLNMRRSKRGPWLSCSGFPKCRGRLGWTTIEEAEQEKLEKALREHEVENPQPPIMNTKGEIVGEEYIPNVMEEPNVDPADTPTASDAA